MFSQRILNCGQIRPNEASQGARETSATVAISALVNWLTSGNN
jgi:hypothetical protein